MAVEVIMPRQGNTVESCQILEWRVKVGDAVPQGAVLCVVETDKASVEVEAEVAGTVLAILHDEGADVPVLQPILILGQAGEDIADLLSAQQRPPSALSGPETASGPKIAPQQKQDNSSPNAKPPQPVDKSQETGPQKTGGEPRKLAVREPAASPRARQSAAQHIVNLQHIQGSGPGGRILEEDILSFVQQRPPLSPAARDAYAQADIQPPADKLAHYQPENVREDTPSGMRQLIARRMMASLQSTAQYTLHSSASATAIKKWRALYKASDESLGLRGITIGDMVLFALSRTLPRHPQLNAEYKNGKIYQYEQVHLGIAVDTPRGLMVPVIQNANEKSLKQLSTETKNLARACLQGSIQAEALAGATFTITNLGAWGVEHFTPVINTPQVAILGLGAITMRAVQKNETTVFEPHIGLSMTIDHQVVDGALAAQFLNDLASLLTRFELLASL